MNPRLGLDSLGVMVQFVVVDLGSSLGFEYPISRNA